MLAVVVEEEAWGNTAAILLCCEGLGYFCGPVGGAVCGEIREEGAVEEGGGGAVCGKIREEGAVEEEEGGAVCEGTCE